MRNIRGNSYTHLLGLRGAPTRLSDRDCAGFVRGSVPKAPSAPAAWTKEPNYRQVLISAQSQNNLPPPKLTLANLHLFKVANNYRLFTLNREPVTVGILVDNSGSMEPKLPQTKDALADFIRDLNPGDEIFVDAFSDRPYTVAPLTTDHKIAIDHLGMMQPTAAPRFTT